jgi:hypothetical protein
MVILNGVLVYSIAKKSRPVSSPQNRQQEGNAMDHHQELTYRQTAPAERCSTVLFRSGGNPGSTAPNGDDSERR